MRTTTLIALCLALCAPLARADRYVLLDLGAGDDAVIGLHVTAESIRESVRELPEDVTRVVLRLDSSGGLLSEVPALAELLSTELPETHRVVLWVDEASSSASLVALSAPTLVMSDRGVLHGHEPFERIGDLDLGLVGEQLDATLRVGDRCALLGDRPALVARALVTPTPLSLDERDTLHADTAHGEVISTGERVLSLDAPTAQRLNVADAIVSDEADLARTLALGKPCDCAGAKAVLTVHRERTSALIERARDAKDRLDAMLESGEADERRAHELLGVLEVTLALHPRIGAYLGIDDERIDSYQDRIAIAATSSP